MSKIEVQHFPLRMIGGPPCAEEERKADEAFSRFRKAYRGGAAIKKHQKRHQMALRALICCKRGE